MLHLFWFHASIVALVTLPCFFCTTCFVADSSKLQTWQSKVIIIYINGQGCNWGIYRRRCRYRLFIKYCVFSLKFWDFSELCQFCCSAGFLPAWCVYTHWRRGKTELGIFKKKSEKTQYLMNTLYLPTLKKNTNN